MSARSHIKAYIAAQSGQKQDDMQGLHRIILKAMPRCKLWFLDGKDERGRTVSNPNIGYGTQTLKYADGSSREFYQVGLSANTTGMSVYIMGLKDKKYLPKRYGKKIGQASVTGYCIKFKALKNIDVGVLMDAVRDGVGRTRG